MLRMPKPAMFNCIGIYIPQNGVMDDGPLSYRQGGPSPQVATDSFLDSQNGNMDSSDIPKRPRNLNVSTKGTVVQNLREEDMEDSEGGSLPCTPELQCDSEAEVSGYSTASEALENETKRLLHRFLLDFTGISKSRRNEEKAISTMKRVISDVLQKHRYAYNGMINKLSLDNRGDDMSFVSEVARSLFADQTTNWGRIASLVAFGAAVCQYLKEKGRENCVELVSQEISTYLLSEQRDWLLKNNSWDGFVEFFRVEDPESTVRKTLMAFAGLAGIGASLALIMR
ncbi:induced myeloid leukemia cell differentiation protein Mcl-1b [Pholidichthys leucotaenia]